MAINLRAFLANKKLINPKGPLSDDIPAPTERSLMKQLRDTTNGPFSRLAHKRQMNFMKQED